VFAFFNLRIILTEKMELHMKFWQYLRISHKSDRTNACKGRLGYLPCFQKVECYIVMCTHTVTAFRNV
jgi:hypothetical protein